MMDFFKTVLGLLRFEKGPDAFPSSVPLLILSLALFALTSFGQTRFTENLDNAVGTALVTTGILVAFVLAVMGMAGLVSRLIQTMTTFAIAGTAINLFAILSFTILYFAPVPLLEMGITSPIKVPMIIFGFLLTYTILRRALAKSGLVCFALTVVYFLLIVQFTAPFTSDPQMQRERPRPEAGVGQKKLE